MPRRPPARLRSSGHQYQSKEKVVDHRRKHHQSKFKKQFVFNFKVHLQVRLRPGRLR